MVNRTNHRRAANPLRNSVHIRVSDEMYKHLHKKGNPSEYIRRLVQDDINKRK